jgi:hypothetical protein
MHLTTFTVANFNSPLLPITQTGSSHVYHHTYCAANLHPVLITTPLLPGCCTLSLHSHFKTAVFCQHHKSTKLSIICCIHSFRTDFMLSVRTIESTERKSLFPLHSLFLRFVTTNSYYFAGAEVELHP